MDHSVSEIMADIWPLPSTLNVDSGQSILEPTLSAGHLSGQAACRYWVMPFVVEEPYVR